MIDLKTIDIDFEKKKITIWDNQELYQTIKSGRVQALVPIWNLLVGATIEYVDSTLAQTAKLLTCVLEATYLYHRAHWNLSHGMRVHVSVEGVGTMTATPTVSTD